MTIATTRIFKSGNSLAVRIPKDMTPADLPEQAQIEWRNGVWIIRPLHRRSLAGLMDRFKAFSPDFMASGREVLDQAPRKWPEAAKAPAARRRASTKK
jgi:antitoxin VapB